MNKSQPEKAANGTPTQSYIDAMRTKAWLRYVLRNLNVQSLNAAAEILASKTAEGKKPRLDRYVSGDMVPKSHTLKHIDSIGLTPSPSYIFSTGLEFNGKVVPFWSLFDESTGRLSEAVEAGLRHHGNMTPTVDWVTQVANLFVTLETWQEICQRESFVYDEDNNPTAHLDSKNANLWFLAAAIAQWRLCMLAQDRVSPMAYLLRCLVSGPYRDTLQDWNIYENMHLLFIAWDAEYHSLLGNRHATAALFRDM